MNDFERFMLINENESLKKEIEGLKSLLKGYQSNEDNEEVVEIEKCTYSYETSKEFEDQLKEIRRKQKVIVKNKEAIIHDQEWTVEGSSSRGNKLMKDISNLALMSFNDYCDTLIVKLKYSGIDKVKDNITNKYNKINKLLKSFCSRISVDLLKLKFEEADLKCGWLRKKEEEKEEIKRKEAEIREQLKLEEEINKAKEKIQYEQSQYNSEIVRLQEQLINEKGNNKVIMKQLAKLQDKVSKLEEKKKDVLNRQINKKAGWIYIISNPLLDGVVKIGVTRRLNAMDRINELGSASVPFKFKVHSIIFSEDAFKLEHDLHIAFDDYRVNKVNKQKEHFRVSLDAVKEEVLKHNPTATFIDNPTVDEYELSKAM